MIGTVSWSVGNQMVTVTQTYVIYDITQSSLQLGILGAAVVITSIAMSLISGILADRFSRRVLLMCGSVMTSTSMLAVGLLLITGRVEPWHIQVGGAIHGAALVLDWTARFSLLPNMLPREILIRAVSFDLSTFNLGRVLAPLLWGLIVANWGYEWTYIAIAGIMALNILIVATYRPRTSVAHVAHQPIWQDIVEITAVVRGNAILSGNIIFTFVNAVLMGGLIYLLTPIATDVFEVGPNEYSQLFASVAVGAFVGGIFLGITGGFRRTGYALLATNVLTVTTVMLFALAGSLFLGFTFALMFGLLNAMHVGLGNIALQTAISDNVRGRLAGIYEVAWAGFPAGGFLLGALANASDPSTSLIVGCGAVLLVTIVMAVFNPTLRQLRLRI